MKTKPSRPYRIREVAGILLREVNHELPPTVLDTPEVTAGVFRQLIEPSMRFNPGAENFVVLFLNTRRRLIGFQVTSTGTLDTILVHAREVFRAAIIESAAAIIIMHNHPSGDPTPSEADIKVTRDLIRAGQLLKIDVLDHIII